MSVWLILAICFAATAFVAVCAAFSRAAGYEIGGDE